MSGNLQDGVKVCGTLGCPLQGQRMEKSIDPSGIEIDRCRHCGTVALDNGELEHIIRYTANRVRASLGGQQIPVYQPPVVVVETYGYESGVSSMSDLFDSLF